MSIDNVALFRSNELEKSQTYKLSWENTEEDEEPSTEAFEDAEVTQNPLSDESLLNILDYGLDKNTATVKDTKQPIPALWPIKAKKNSCEGKYKLSEDEFSRRTYSELTNSGRASCRFNSSGLSNNTENTETNKKSYVKNKTDGKVYNKSENHSIKANIENRVNTKSKHEKRVKAVTCNLQKPLKKNCKKCGHEVHGKNCHTTKSSIAQTKPETDSRGTICKPVIKNAPVKSTKALKPSKSKKKFQVIIPFQKQWVVQSTKSTECMKEESKTNKLMGLFQDLSRILGLDTQDNFSQSFDDTSVNIKSLDSNIETIRSEQLSSCPPSKIITSPKSSNQSRVKISQYSFKEVPKSLNELTAASKAEFKQKSQAFIEMMDENRDVFKEIRQMKKRSSADSCIQAPIEFPHHPFSRKLDIRKDTRPKGFYGFTMSFMPEDNTFRAIEPKSSLITESIHLTTNKNINPQIMTCQTSFQKDAVIGNDSFERKDGPRCNKCRKDEGRRKTFCEKRSSFRQSSRDLFLPDISESESEMSRLTQSSWKRKYRNKRFFVNRAWQTDTESEEENSLRPCFKRANKYCIQKEISVESFKTCDEDKDLEAEEQEEDEEKEEEVDIEEEEAKEEEDEKCEEEEEEKEDEVDGEESREDTGNAKNAFEERKVYCDVHSNNFKSHPKTYEEARNNPRLIEEPQVEIKESKYIEPYENESPESPETGLVCPKCHPKTSKPIEIMPDDSKQYHETVVKQSISPVFSSFHSKRLSFTSKQKEMENECEWTKLIRSVDPRPSDFDKEEVLRVTNEAPSTTSNINSYKTEGNIKDNQRSSFNNNMENNKNAGCCSNNVSGNNIGGNNIGGCCGNNVSGNNIGECCGNNIGECCANYTGGCCCSKIDGKADNKNRQISACGCGKPTNNKNICGSNSSSHKPNSEVNSITKCLSLSDGKSKELCNTNEQIKDTTSFQNKPCELQNDLDEAKFKLPDFLDQLINMKPNLENVKTYNIQDVFQYPEGIIMDTKPHILKKFSHFSNKKIEDVYWGAQHRSMCNFTGSCGHTQHLPPSTLKEVQNTPNVELHTLNIELERDKIPGIDMKPEHSQMVCENYAQNIEKKSQIYEEAKYQKLRCRQSTECERSGNEKKQVETGTKYNDYEKIDDRKKDQIQNQKSREVYGYPEDVAKTNGFNSRNQTHVECSVRESSKKYKQQIENCQYCDQSHIRSKQTNVEKCNRTVPMTLKEYESHNKDEKVMKCCKDSEVNVEEEEESREDENLCNKCVFIESETDDSVSTNPDPKVAKRKTSMYQRYLSFSTEEKNVIGQRPSKKGRKNYWTMAPNNNPVFEKPNTKKKYMSVMENESGGNKFKKDDSVDNDVCRTNKDTKILDRYKYKMDKDGSRNYVNLDKSISKQKVYDVNQKSSSIYKKFYSNGNSVGNVRAWNGDTIDFDDRKDRAWNCDKVDEDQISEFDEKCGYYNGVRYNNHKKNSRNDQQTQKVYYNPEIISNRDADSLREEIDPRSEYIERRRYKVDPDIRQYNEPQPQQSNQSLNTCIVIDASRASNNWKPIAEEVSQPEDEEDESDEFQMAEEHSEDDGEFGPVYSTLDVDSIISKYKNIRAKRSSRIDKFKETVVDLIHTCEEAFH